MIGLVTILVAGVFSVGVIWCSCKIGADGNWYEERKAEMNTEDDSKN